MMRTTIHEFEENPEEYIRIVESGESIELMDGNRPVAMITPVKKDETTRERLIREGQLIPAEHDGPLPPPLPAIPGQRPLSDILREMREDERF